MKKGGIDMLDYDIDKVFDALNEISLMTDEEFENARLGFEQNGLVLERDKNKNINVTVKNNILDEEAQQ
jgi:hypothetical protein